jgi:hypothetical protein
MDRYVPLFDSQPIFGALGAVSTASFAPTCAEVDAFLGLAPDTTQAAGVPVYAVTGTLAGPDVPTVEAVRALLSSYASTGPVLMSVPVSRDDGLPWPGGYG